RVRTVGTEEAVQQERDSLEKARDRVFRPRLAVLRVDGSIWQPAVTEFATACSAVLIDVSEPTPNLAWEVETLLQDHPDRCVLVGERSQVRALLRSGSPDPARRTVATLIDGREVIAYTNDPRGVRRFTRALRRRLASVTLLVEPPTRIPWRQRVLALRPGR